MESLCCRRPIIQAMFACAECNELPGSAWLSCQRTAWNGKTRLEKSQQGRLLGRDGGWTEIAMTLRVPIISLFMEEGDKSTFYLWNTDFTEALSRQWKGKSSSDLASLAALLLLGHHTRHLQPACRELITSAPCRRAFVHGEGSAGLQDAAAFESDLRCQRFQKEEHKTIKLTQPENNRTKERKKQKQKGPVFMCQKWTPLLWTLRLIVACMQHVNCFTCS